MIELDPFTPVLLCALALHGAPTVTRPPVPHWIVLFVAVPTFCLAAGGAVLLIDRLLARFEDGSTER